MDWRVRARRQRLVDEIQKNSPNNLFYYQLFQLVVHEFMPMKVVFQNYTYIPLNFEGKSPYNVFLWTSPSQDFVDARFIVCVQGRIIVYVSSNSKVDVTEEGELFSESNYAKYICPTGCEVEIFFYPQGFKFPEKLEIIFQVLEHLFVDPKDSLEDLTIDPDGEFYSSFIDDSDNEILPPTTTHIVQLFYMDKDSLKPLPDFCYFCNEQTLEVMENSICLSCKIQLERSNQLSECVRLRGCLIIGGDFPLFDFKRFQKENFSTTTNFKCSLCKKTNWRTFGAKKFVCALCVEKRQVLRGTPHYSSTFEITFKSMVDWSQMNAAISLFDSLIERAKLRGRTFPTVLSCLDFIMAHTEIELIQEVSFWKLHKPEETLTSTGFLAVACALQKLILTKDVSPLDRRKQTKIKLFLREAKNKFLTLNYIFNELSEVEKMMLLFDSHYSNPQQNKHELT